MPSRRTGWMVALAMVGTWSCSSNKAGERPDADPAATMGQIRPPRDSGEKVSEFDLNNDLKPDVWSYAVRAKGPDGQDVERLVRKELDINWDGRVDITKFYDDQENVSRELTDLDFDGKVDTAIFLDKGVIVRKERDLDSNSRPDVWIYYEKARLVRKERDSNGDGKVDYWEYWVNDQVERIGEDLDGDGNVDKWTQSPPGPTPG